MSRFRVVYQWNGRNYVLTWRDGKLEGDDRALVETLEIVERAWGAAKRVLSVPTGPVADSGYLKDPHLALEFVREVLEGMRFRIVEVEADIPPLPPVPPGAKT